MVSQPRGTWSKSGEATRPTRRLSREQTWQRRTPTMSAQGTLIPLFTLWQMLTKISIPPPCMHSTCQRHTRNHLHITIITHPSLQRQAITMSQHPPTLSQGQYSADSTGQIPTAGTKSTTSGTRSWQGKSPRPRISQPKSKRLPSPLAHQGLNPSEPPYLLQSSPRRAHLQRYPAPRETHS